MPAERTLDSELSAAGNAEPNVWTSVCGHIDYNGVVAHDNCSSLNGHQNNIS